MNPGPLTGVRVVEVASHVFVPAATAVLAEWGAEVLKVEPPQTGDAYRGLVTAGLHKTLHGVDVNFQYANRSKESIGIDCKTEAGRALLYRLVAQADVFATSFRPDARRRLGIDVDHIRTANPGIVYVRGSGQGVDGPEAANGAYDYAAYWARSGIAARLADPETGAPQPPPPAFGDYAAAMSAAAGISAALYKRATTGEGSEVDVSLLAAGMWQLQPDVIDSRLGDASPPARLDRFAVANPMVNHYRTRDGRYVFLVMIEADRHWPNLCEVLGAPHLLDDARFVDAAARRGHVRECVEALDAVFATRDLDHWCEALQAATGVWAPVRHPGEVADDPQVVANGYVADAELGDGAALPMVTAPVQFDRRPASVRRAPEVGEHTELALVRLGITWDEIADLKSAGVIT